MKNSKQYPGGNSSPQPLKGTNVQVRKPASSNFMGGSTNKRTGNKK